MKNPEQRDKAHHGNSRMITLICLLPVSAVAYMNSELKTRAPKSLSAQKRTSEQHEIFKRFISGVAESEQINVQSN